MIAFVVTTAFSSDQLFRRVEFGLVAGSGVAMIAFILALPPTPRRRGEVDQASVIEAVADRPLDG